MSTTLKWDGQATCETQSKFLNGSVGVVCHYQTFGKGFSLGQRRQARKKLTCMGLWKWPMKLSISTMRTRGRRDSLDKTKYRVGLMSDGTTLSIV